MKLLALATILFLAFANAAMGASSVEVVDLQRVSGPSPFQPGGSHACSQDDGNPLAHPELEIEPSVAVDPSNDDRIAVAWPQDNALGIVVASSQDGGGSWRRVVVDGFTTCTGSDKNRVSHPRLSFARGGRLYLAAFPVGEWTPDPRNTLTEILVARSDDGGVTWSDPQDITQAESLNDFDGMATEPDGGAVDVVWAENEGVDPQGEPIYLSRSTDGGRTWIKNLVTRARPNSIGFSKVAALPGGELVVFIQEVEFSNFIPEGHGPISVLVSQTKGRTWSEPVTVVDDAINEWPAVAITRKGLVYLAYRTRAADGRFSVWVARSDDGAKTWTEPIPAFSYPFARGLPHIALAVTGERTLGILHFESVDDRHQARVAVSGDCGHAWTSATLGRSFTQTDPLTPIDLGFAQGLAAVPHGFLAGVSLGGQPDTIGPTDIFVGSVEARGGSATSCGP